jgi:hypothetical protein
MTRLLLAHDLSSEPGRPIDEAIQFVRMESTASMNSSWQQPFATPAFVEFWHGAGQD